MKLLVLMILIFTQFGCGGGGSSNTNEQKSARYTGEQRSAKIDRKNAFELISSLYWLIEPSYSLGYIIHYSELPVFFNYENDDFDAVSNEICESGSVDYIEISDSATSVRFESCSSDDVIFDGLVEVSFNKDQSVFVSVKNLQFTNDFERIFYNGHITQEMNGKIIVDSMLMTSQTRGVQLYTEGFIIDQGALSGDIHHSVEGVVTVESDTKIETLTIKNKDLDSITIEYLDEFTPHNSDLTIPGAKISLNTSSLEKPLITHAPIRNLTDHVYQENYAPRITLEPSLSVDRLASLVFDDSQFQDDNYDFLTSEILSVTLPEKCNVSDHNNGQVGFSFVFDCQGPNQIVLKVSDGLTSTTGTFDIDVIPLPAEISPIETVSMTKGEILSIPVMVDNTEEDGPFNYSIGYAPKGLYVNSEGIITGSPVPFIQEENASFKVAIDVFNGRNTRLEFDIDLNGTQAKKSLTPNMKLCNDGASHDWQGVRTIRWSDVDGNHKPDLVCALKNSYVIYETNGNSIEAKYIELNPWKDEKLMHVIQTDMNGDSVDEIILGYPNTILVINGVNKQVVKEFDLGDDYYFYKIVPVNTDYNGFILYSNVGETGDLSGYYLYSLDDERLNINPATNSAGIRAIGNIDSDPEPEFIDGMNRVLDFDNTVESFEFPINYVADHDGDGEDSPISLWPHSDQIYDPIYTEYYLNGSSDTFSLIVHNKSTILKTYMIKVPDEFKNDSNGLTQGRAFLVNIDQDEEMEVLLNYSSDAEKVLVYDLNRDDDSYVFDEVLSLNAYPESRYGPSFNHTQIMQLEDGNIAFSINSGLVSYSKDLGLQTVNFKAPSYWQSIHDGGGLSQPFIQPDGVMNLYYISSLNDNFARVQINSEGGIVSMNSYDDIEYNVVDYIYEIPVSAETSKEFVANIRLDSPGYSVFDSLSGDPISRMNLGFREMAPGRFFSGDINSDRKEDLFSQNGTTVTWIDPIQGIFKWQLPEGDRLRYLVEPGAFLVDANKDGDSELVLAVENIHYPKDSDLEIMIYRFDGHTSLEEFRKIPLSFDSHDTHGDPLIGIQDVDGDDRLEIIVANNCSHPAEIKDSTIIHIIDDDFSEYSTVYSDYCLDSIPSIKGKAEKNNIIATSDIGTLDNENSKFIEIDAGTGTTIWESVEYLGKISKGSLLSFGDDIYTSRKIAVFDVGLYSFE